jgi:hypothetical protein
MTDINKIQYLVGTVMRDNPELRLHKNRYKLYNILCNKTGEALSPESIMRAQRKLWEKGLYLPEGADLIEWNEVRRKKTKEMEEYART